MPIEPDVRDALLAAVPSLRAFAISLSGSVDRADDLVQDTLMRALANIDRFEPGTNLHAWLFTILRNLFHSEYRKRRREVEDVDGAYAARLATAPEQGSRLDFDDFRTALAKLPTDQREALLLVGAASLSYEEAAQIMNCAIGTVKSRVNRARSRLGPIAVARRRRGSRSRPSDARGAAGSGGRVAPRTALVRPRGGAAAR
jgi:RNA polymerase sigma-70 factor (ECF subfamily)